MAHAATGRTAAWSTSNFQLKCRLDVSERQREAHRQHHRKAVDVRAAGKPLNGSSLVVFDAARRPCPSQPRSFRRNLNEELTVKL